MVDNAISWRRLALALLRKQEPSWIARGAGTAKVPAFAGTRALQGAVIPAKAGIQSHQQGRCPAPWTPAFAGVTDGQRHLFVPSLPRAPAGAGAFFESARCLNSEGSCFRRNTGVAGRRHSGESRNPGPPAGSLPVSLDPGFRRGDGWVRHLSSRRLALALLRKQEPSWITRGRRNASGVGAVFPAISWCSLRRQSSDLTALE
jgi:hypothetical protein